MELLETLKRKIESAGDLRSVVRTMKVLAAANIREHEKAVVSLKEYNRTIEMGLHIVLRNIPGEIQKSKPMRKNRLAAVVFGSERGMCGQFNEQIADYAIDMMNKLEVRYEDRTVMALGERVTALLEEAGQTVHERFPIFGTHADIASIMQEVLIKIEEWRMKRGIEQIVLFYNRPSKGISYSPAMLYLLPFDTVWFNDMVEKKWPSRTLPAFTMDWNRLFSSLVRQYLFVSLYRAFVESLASENTSRLFSMQSAEKNIEERLKELNARFHHQRQASITAELLDVATGFEAITGGSIPHLT
jgi:F-type H+-transporting ATPase subunit gamma